MDIDRDKMLAKAARLLAMAERGEGGERDNASRMLGELLDKHGLTLDELDDNQPKWWMCDLKTLDEVNVVYNAIRATFAGEELTANMRRMGSVRLSIYGLRGGQLASASVMADRVLDAYRDTKAAMQERHRMERAAERRAKQEADKRRACERKVLLGSFLIRNDFVPPAPKNSKPKKRRKTESAEEMDAFCTMMAESQMVDRTDRLTAGHNQLPKP